MKLSGRRMVYVMNRFGCCFACVQRCKSSAIILPRSWNAATKLCRRAVAQLLKINATTPISGVGLKYAPLICTVVSTLPKRRYKKSSLCRKRSKIHSIRAQSCCLEFSLIWQQLHPRSFSSVILTTLPHKSIAIAQSDLAYRMSPGQCSRGHKNVIANGDF